VRRRLDAELVRRGLADSRTQARTLIEAGRVRVGGAPATKVARQVDAAEAVLVEGDGPRFVGRGGEKLDGALEAFAVDPSGLRVLDAGASTGGFTDALLQRGAREVVALDVGHGQLHERLRADPRVVVMERTNLRHVDADALGPFDAVVGDLSFISLTKVAEVLASCVVPGGWLVLLVKPQFEAGRREVSRGRGVISDPEEWAGAVERVVDAFAAVGVEVEDLVVSPLRGADGNVEFLVRFRRGSAAPAPVPADLRDRVDDALELVGLASTRTAAVDPGEPLDADGGDDLLVADEART
jgi:23S rRNA (cytidine1920-2'-O)/16S rRNA (cytidine1409-2'-O)-methyltransferase